MVTDKISTLTTLSNVLFIIGGALLFVSLYLFKSDDYVSFFKMQKGDTSDKKRSMRNEDIKEKVNVYDTSGLSSESLSTKLEKIEKSNNEKIKNVPKRQTSFSDVDDDDDGLEETTYLVKEDKLGADETSLLDFKNKTNNVSNVTFENKAQVDTQMNDENIDGFEYADRLIENSGSEETSDLSIDLKDSTEELYLDEGLNDSNEDNNISTDYVGSILYESDGSDETQVLSKEKIVSRVKNKKERRIINDWGGSDTFAITKDDNVVITHTDETLNKKN